MNCLFKIFTRVGAFCLVTSYSLYISAITHFLSTNPLATHCEPPGVRVPQVEKRCLSIWKKCLHFVCLRAGGVISLRCFLSSFCENPVDVFQSTSFLFWNPMDIPWKTSTEFSKKMKVQPDLKVIVIYECSYI